MAVRSNGHKMILVVIILRLEATQNKLLHLKEEKEFRVQLTEEMRLII